MNYKDLIRETIQNVPSTLVDINAPREKPNKPTQISSNFTINREQGDWAESVIQRAINETSKNYVAVKYGKADRLIAGEPGFDKLWEEFQIELDTIGKRPDLLIFKKEYYNQDWNYDIALLPKEELAEIVPTAIAGLEIRSSAYLFNKYVRSMQERYNRNVSIVLRTKDDILANYRDLLEHAPRKKLIEVLENISVETITELPPIGRTYWRSSQRLVELTEKFKILKKSIDIIQKRVQKRDFLSITPKVEDLKVIYKWVQTFGVPHYYFQVFFDKAFGLSYQDILSIISHQENEGEIFFVERNKRNQEKYTIHINSTCGLEVAHKIDMPIHKSDILELNRGRLVFYVKFQGGTAYLDVTNLCEVLGINQNDF